MLQKIIDFLIPHQCHCGSEFSGAPVCLSCQAAMLKITKPCSLCGKQLDQNGFCMSCRGRFSGVITRAAYSYECVAVREFVKKSKFSKNIAALKWQGRQMVSLVSGIDVLVPIPLHIKRLRQRGFNQSQFYCSEIRKETGIKVDIDSVRRIRDTAHQSTTKSAAERDRNIRNAFSSTRIFSGLNVGLVDDVTTTGSTLNELASVIRGARSITAIVFARR